MAESKKVKRVSNAQSFPAYPPPDPPEIASPPAPGLEQVSGALSPWNQMTQPLRQGHEALIGALSDLRGAMPVGPGSVRPPREGSAQAWGALGGPDTQLQALQANAAADIRNPSRAYRQREMLKLVQQDPVVAFMRGASFDVSAIPEFYKYFVTGPQMEEKRRKEVEDWQRREQWKQDAAMQQQHMQPGPDGSTYFGRSQPGPGSSMQNNSYGVEVRSPFASELDYFRKNPKVSGMAAEDNRVIMNPYSSLSEKERQSVLMNEASRVHMRRGVKPTFQITPEQAKAFSSYGDEDSQRQTIAARILSGDPSGLSPTPEQSEYVNALRKKMNLPVR